MRSERAVQEAALTAARFVTKARGGGPVVQEDGRGPYNIKPENLGVVTEKKTTQARKEKNKKK